MISGLQKMTLLDFPGRVACTVFLSGCNFRCPFCHNSDLLTGTSEPLMTQEEFLDFLQHRKGLLDGVCVSGGEPTLRDGLEPLLRAIKQLGYAVKLDTNGSRPDVLKRLVSEGLVDHVAMDVKNSPQRYAETVGIEGYTVEAVAESLRFLLTDAVSYELRTTVVEQLHDADSIRQMGEWLSTLVPPKRPRILYLQNFVDRDTVLFEGLNAPVAQQMEMYAHILSQYVEKCAIRGE